MKKKISKKKNKNQYLNIIIPFIVLVVVLVVVFLIITLTTKKPKLSYDAKYILNQNVENYEGYSKFDLYKHKVMNLVPKYIQEGKIKIEDGYKYDFGKLDDFNYKSTVSVKENKNSYNYYFSSKYKETNKDVLDYNLLSYKDKYILIDNVFKVSDGYIIVYNLGHKSEVFIEKFNNDFKYVWTYKMINIDVDDFSIQDFLEYKNKYYMMIEESDDGDDYTTRMLALNTDGREIYNKPFNSYVERFLNVTNNNIYICSEESSYFDTVSKTMIYNFDDVELPYIDDVSYEFVGGNPNEAFYLSLEDGSDKDKYNILYKFNSKKKLVKKVNLKDLAKEINKDLSTSKFTKFEASMKENRIIVKYSIDQNEYNYDGLLMFNEDLKVIKNIISKVDDKSTKELGHQHFYSIDDYNYSNGKLSVKFELEDNDSLYVIYDKNGKLIFNKKYANLYFSDGSIYTSHFDENSIVNYEEFLNRDTHYLKIVTIKR